MVPMEDYDNDELYQEQRHAVEVLQSAVTEQETLVSEVDPYEAKNTIVR